MFINRLKLPIATARELEDTNARTVKQRADLDYIAMMCDVDIPTEEDGNDVSED